MRTLRLISPILVLLCIFFASCEKKEQPLALPPQNGSEHAVVDMGEDYNDQFFYDLKSGNVVYTSKVKSWDLAFEANATGYHVFLNGGLVLFVYNTHKTDMKDVTSYDAYTVKDAEWTPDMPCLIGDSTAIGDWADKNNRSKMEVYILKSNDANIPDTFTKLQFLSVTDKEYTFSYSDLKHPYGKTITIPKDPNYNYVYYSLINERITTPEPPKNTWDIVFTRYTHVYHELNNFPYLVTGVLLNPNNTTAAVDSLTPYQDVNAGIIPKMTFSNFRNTIGFNWKSYDIKAGHYTTNPAKIYTIRNRNDQYYKLHFLDFYNSKGVKGAPTFEYEQIQ